MFKLNSAQCDVFEGDAQLHLFVACDVLPSKARKVHEISFRISKQDAPLDRDIVLDVPKGAKWAAVVAELYLSIPNYEMTKCTSMQGFVNIDLSKVSGTQRMQLVSPILNKAFEMSPEWTKAFASITVTAQRMQLTSVPPLLAPEVLSATHLGDFRNAYMAPVRGMQTIENNAFETVRVSDVTINGRMVPSWTYWQTIEPPCITNDDIDQWMAMALLLLPDGVPTGLQGIKPFSTTHFDFLTLLLGIPATASRYSDDTMAVTSSMSQKKRGNTYVAEIDTYSMSTATSSGDCEDRARTIVAEVFPALCAYSGTNSIAQVLLAPLRKYRAFAAVVGMSGMPAWAHYIAIFTSTENQLRTLVVDTIYPAFMREGKDSTQVVLENIKEQFHFEQNDLKWPSTSFRPPFIFCQRNMHLIVVMRMFESNGVAQWLVPLSDRCYGACLSDIVAGNFNFKETRLEQKDKDEWLPHLVWRHPPVRFKPLAAPTVSGPLPAGIAFLTPSNNADRQTITRWLEQKGKVQPIGHWSVDSQRDTDGVWLSRWTPSK